ncbi:hypothetical protein [Leeuwenhoekiella parthenopeia]|uniref:Adhesin domain-containing protein n=1 Tax=Leeuwenhoekiella parthenopeia TaxID=2890320 RepID=A0ABS8GTA5_9FLAO|nr:hypothetical protein [Leeuwenhoekiella parthenopeia]MCC4213230.1 hypothetical protein [Leeuwenhoekiella parthenopeia]
MKMHYSKLILFLLLMPMMATATNDPDRFNGRYTKEKKITKDYKVKADALLKINNSYGNVDLIAWDQNRITIEVIVRTNGNDEEQVIKKLEEIDVSFEADASMVAARTKIKESNSSWWSSWINGNDNVKMEINYKVRVPISNTIDISNDYGGISLDKLKGVAKISCDYGHMDLGELLADNNELRFDYTNNTRIAYMKSGKISADYSSFTLEKAQNVVLNADYTKSNFDDISKLLYNCDYGSIDIGNAGNIEGSSDYLSVEIGKVIGNLSLNLDYGSVRIDEVTAKAGNIRINTDYASVKMGYNSGYNFNFTIKLSYAGLKGEGDLEFSRKQVESFSKYYEGYHGSKSANNNVNITSEYGGVSLYKIN